MKVAVWSPTPFSGRKSTNLLLLALQTIWEEGGEQLVLHADAGGSGPEHFLLSGRNRSRMMKQMEFGVDLLNKLLHCRRFDKALAVNAAYTFAGGKLHILPPGNSFFYQEDSAEAAAATVGIMRHTAAEFQNVWVELPAGLSDFSRQVLSAADMVIINLAQSPFELSKPEQMPTFRRELFVVGAYEQRCVYSRRNLMLLNPRLRGKCVVVPYCADYLAACCAGEVEAFWERGSRQGEEEITDPFFKAVKKAYLGWKRCRAQVP